MHRSKIFLWFLVAFIGGVASASFFSLPVEILFGMIFLGGICLVATLTRSNPSRYFILISFILFGFTGGGLRMHQSIVGFELIPDSAIGISSTFAGRIVSDPEESLTFSSFVVRIDGNRDFRVLVRASRFNDFKYGDYVELKGELRRPENFSNFDYVGFLRKDGISAEMLGPTITAHESGDFSMRRLLFGVKDYFVSHIKDSSPEPFASVIAGITVGERRGIPQDIMQNFIDSGTVHIFALSGYNIVIIAWAVSWALQRLYAPPIFSFWISVVSIIFFVLATGASASVVRAGAMGVLVLLALFKGKRYASPSALLFVAAIMLLHNPQLLRFDRGFLLSAFATAGLIFISPKLRRFFPRIRRPKNIFFKFRNMVYDAALATISAQCAVLPILFEIGSRLHWGIVPANILIILLIPTVMFLGFAIGLLWFLGPILLPFIGIAVGIVSYQLKVAEFFAKIIT